MNIARAVAGILAVGILAWASRNFYRFLKQRREYRRNVQTWRDHIRKKYGSQ